MFGVDEWLGQMAEGNGPVVALLVALLLGLRHATDPDHLLAVSTLIASDGNRDTRQAGRLGLAWGLGHAATLVSFGLPIVLFRAYLPTAILWAAEVLVVFVIVFLAVRLWRQRHARPIRSPLEAFGIGLLHGMAGSAGVGVLLLAAVPAREEAVAALVVLAAGTALSMMALSYGLGRLVARPAGFEPATSASGGQRSIH